MDDEFARLLTAEIDIVDDKFIVKKIDDNVKIIEFNGKEKIIIDKRKKSKKT